MTIPDRILVVNAGSSSVKLHLLDARDRVVGEHETGALSEDGDATELLDAISDFPDAPDAVGHRVVHGGARFTGAASVDDDVRAALDGLRDLAPLHQAPALAALDAVHGALPGVPQVACFDTAFHADMDPAAATYAVPESWRTDLGVRRYGFHGLSFAHAARRAAEMVGAADARLVICHLGSGASLAAVRSGRSHDTTMGFTPLDGLVMSTRSGALDPGLVLWLARRGHDVSRLSEALERESGLLALAGTDNMREILSNADAGDDRATLALAVHLHRLRGAIAEMAAALGGLDALVFTGGIGEASPRIRAAAADGLGFLGIAVDPARNEGAAAGDDAEIGTVDDAVRTLVVATREDLEIARQVRGLLRR